ncbi:MAG: PQQ-binding-like beta-propeller repeat protein [Terriglobia bacterium]
MKRHSRRCFLHTAGALFLAPLSSRAAEFVKEKDWPQFRGNIQLTGVAGSSVPAALKVVWTFEAGESIESSAAIVDGVTYVGTQAGELIALDLISGALRWRYKTEQGIGESSPCVNTGIVYVGDLAGVLHAVQRKDGKKLWTFKTGAEIKSSPVVYKERVFIGSYDETLYCLSSVKGQLLWKFRISGPVHCTPSIAEDLIFISGCDEVFRAIRIQDGKEAFQLSSGGYTGASPALAGKWAYYGTFNDHVLGVDRAQRKIVWQYENPDHPFPFYSSAAVMNNKVTLGGRDKMVHCIDARSGRKIWTFATKARVDSSPAISDRRVYVGSNDGRFYVLDLESGQLIWDFEAGAAISASPAIAENRVIIGSQDGRLYCFG